MKGSELRGAAGLALDHIADAMLGKETFSHTSG